MWLLLKEPTAETIYAYLNMVVTVVVQVENSKEFRVSSYTRQIFHVFHPLADGLSCILFHLDVKKFPAKKETLRLAAIIGIPQVGNIVQGVTANA